jgi:hypothetical protein
MIFLPHNLGNQIILFIFAAEKNLVLLLFCKSLQSQPK